MRQDENLLTMLALNAEKENENDAEKAKFTYSALQEYFAGNRNMPKVNAHIVLVGGGIISLMAAHYMSELGFEISVIEKKSIGAAASGRNGGAIMTMGRELSEVAFAKHSVGLWGTLHEKGIQTHYKKNGHLMVARNPVEIEHLEQAFELYLKAGIDVKMMDHEEMKMHVPYLDKNIKRGLFSYDDAQAYPFTTIQGLINLLKRKGVKFYPFTEAKGFETSGRSINAVLTDKGKISADYFLISTGPWSTDVCKLLEEHVVVKPRRSQIMVNEIIKKRVIEPFFTGNGVYLRQTHTGNILFGGGGPWEVDGFDVHNTSFAMQLQSKRFIELFPDFNSKQLLRGFAGTVEITPDHTPAFGPLTNWENGFVSAGYNGHGFGVSAVMGKLMSLLVFDETNDKKISNDIIQVIEPMSIKRFKQPSKV